MFIIDVAIIVWQSNLEENNVTFTNTFLSHIQFRMRDVLFKESLETIFVFQSDFC